MFKAEVLTQLRSLGADIARKTKEHMQDPEHRRQFEEWYLQRFGECYQWNKKNKGKTSKH